MDKQIKWFLCKTTNNRFASGWQVYKQVEKLSGGTAYKHGDWWVRDEHIILKTECQRTPKPEYTYEQIVKLAIDGFKDSLKWKRSITDKSKETFYILRRKIFSKAFQDKYFNN